MIYTVLYIRRQKVLADSHVKKIQALADSHVEKVQALADSQAELFVVELVPTCIIILYVTQYCAPVSYTHLTLPTILRV